MAEFCPDCYRKVLGEEKENHMLIISRDYDLCEGCGQYKHVVDGEKNWYEYFYSQILHSLWNGAKKLWSFRFRKK